MELDLQRFRRRTTALSAAPPPPPPPVPPRRKCRRADALTQLRRGRSVESATGRSTAATAALLPRSRHPTTDVRWRLRTRSGEAWRGEAAAVASNSSQTSAKVSVYPSALYYYWEQRWIAKGRKKAKALLELCRDVDYFYEAFYGLFRSLFKYIHYIFPPTLWRARAGNGIFLSQNTGRTETRFIYDFSISLSFTSSIL